jgi:hypothetical protein
MGYKDFYEITDPLKEACYKKWGMSSFWRLQDTTFDPFKMIAFNIQQAYHDA